MEDLFDEPPPENERVKGFSYKEKDYVPNLKDMFTEEALKKWNIAQSGTLAVGEKIERGKVSLFCLKTKTKMDLVDVIGEEKTVLNFGSYS